jgi:hypothetical protein
MLIDIFNFIAFISMINVFYLVDSKTSVLLVNGGKEHTAGCFGFLNVWKLPIVTQNEYYRF